MRYLLLVSLAFFGSGTFGADGDSGITSIHQIDLTQDGPKKPNFVLMHMNVGKLKARNSRGHVILRQFSKRVRAEFESENLPRGQYALAVASSCSPGGRTLASDRYQKSWTELHRFKVESTHTQTEKSLPKAALHEPVGEQTVLAGKALGFFKVNKGKLELIDCKPIN